MTKDEAISRLLSVARQEIGYHETGDNLTKYAMNYDTDTRLYGWDMNGSPWCDYFVDWCFAEAFGFEAMKNMTFQFEGCSGAACRESANYYRNHGAFYQYAEVGDQIFFYYNGDINHTGIVESVTGNVITTIEGNSGDGVKRNTYSNASNIAGFGRPKWECAETKAGDDTAEPITEEEYPVPVQIRYMSTQFPIIKPNMSKLCLECVKMLQAILNAKGEHLTIDGYYGISTQTKVYQWQKSHNLEADKEVGALTWKSLITEK